MNRKFFKGIITVFVFLALKPVQAQDSSSFFILTYTPTHLLNYWLRLDAEKSISQRSSIVFASMMQKGIIRDDRSGGIFFMQPPDNDILSFAFELNFKHYLTDPQKVVSIYLSSGVFYQRSTVRYPGEEYVSFESEGLTFLRLAPAEISQTFNKAGLNISYGMQLRIKKLIMDFYSGVGMRYTLPYKERGHFRSFTRSFFYPAYSGPVAIIGLRIGGIFSKI
ncbi:MAG: hypothetical protein ACK4ND_03955 [Cytophagaceae bacterium]